MFLATHGVLRRGGFVPPVFADTNSFEYDGVSDSIAIGTTSLGITNAISVSAWVKIPTTNTGGGGIAIQVILAEDPTTSSQRNWNLFWRGGSHNNVNFVLHHTNLSISSATTTGFTPNDGNWHHILGTFDGTANANGIKLYIDGVLNKQSTASSTGINSFTSSEPSIGRSTGQNVWNFEGDIDEPSVFDYELTSTQVSSIYGSGVPTSISSLSPVGHWRSENSTFNGSNWTITDSGSGGNNGTSSGMTLASRTTDVPLFDNKSFEYDGVSDTLNLGTPVNLRFNRLDAFSFSAWVKVNATGNNVIFSNQLTSGNFRGYYFAVQSNKLVAIHRSTLSDRLIFNGATNLSSGWNHVVFTYNGSATTSGGQLYINGSADTTSGVGTLIGTAESTNTLYLGSRNSTDNFFDGKVDEPSIFDYELTSTQVSTIYGSGVPTDISILSPVSHWRAENSTWNGSVWSVTDNGSSSNNGTSVSMNLASRTTDVPT